MSDNYCDEYKLRLSGLELGLLFLALPACPFPAGTLIVCRAVYLFVHCAHFIVLSNPFHYIIDISNIDGFRYIGI